MVESRSLAVHLERRKSALLPPIHAQARVVLSQNLRASEIDAKKELRVSVEGDHPAFISSNS